MSRSKPEPGGKTKGGDNAPVGAVVGGGGGGSVAEEGADPPAGFNRHRVGTEVIIIYILL